MFLLLNGVLLTGYLVAAAFFWRYWRRTADWFFLAFSAAFVLLGVERLGLALLNTPEEPKAGMYFARLAAFLLIIAAIVGKNHKVSRRPR